MEQYVRPFFPFCSNYCLENGLPEPSNVTIFIEDHSQVLVNLILQQSQFLNHLLAFQVTKSKVSFDPFEALIKQILTL